MHQCSHIHLRAHASVCLNKMPRALDDIPRRTRSRVSEVFDQVVESLGFPDNRTRVCTYDVPVPRDTGAAEAIWVVFLLFRVTHMAWGGNPQAVFYPSLDANRHACIRVAVSINFLATRDSRRELRRAMWTACRLLVRANIDPLVTIRLFEAGNVSMTRLRCPLLNEAERALIQMYAYSTRSL